MGLMDSFISAMKISEGNDDDSLYDDDEYYDDEYDVEEEYADEKPKKKVFAKAEVVEFFDEAPKA